MRDLTVTLVQANQLWEDKEGNLAHFEKLLAEIEQTDLIVLPEMFHTGFTMNAELLAEEMNDSQGLNWLLGIARRKEAAIYTSLIIKEAGCFYNRGVFVFPDGTFTCYDKRKRFAMAGEDTVFSRGEKEVIVDYLGWKINLQICYDLRFPENIRNSIVHNQAKYDMLLYVANWPERRVLHWDALLKARAIENQCFVIGVNRVGEDGNQISYSGNSTAIDELGNQKIILSTGMDTIYSVVCSSIQLSKTRENLPFLRDSE